MCFTKNVLVIWDAHCNICDDIIRNNSETRCPECNIFCCKYCVFACPTKKWFHCIYEERGDACLQAEYYTAAEMLRRMLLFKVFSSDNYNHEQLTNETSYDYFPFLSKLPNVIVSHFPVSRQPCSLLFDADSHQGQQLCAAMAHFRNTRKPFQ